MSKKDSTKKADARKRLAAAISEILTNPETPVELYNAVGDVRTDWTSAHLKEVEADPDDILRCLEAYERGETKRTGGRG